MRSPRFLIPVALLVPLALPASAPAAETVVDVVDFEFKAKEVQIQPGDTVTWSFDADGHTTTRDQGDFERWDAPRSLGETYSREFPKAGKYAYVCTPHAFFNPPMRGVVQVGSDTVATTFKKARATGLRKAVRLSLTLNEEAAVTWAVKGTSTKARREEGQEALQDRQGPSDGQEADAPGRYSVKVTAVDRFADKSSKTLRFTVKD